MELLDGLGRIEIAFRATKGEEGTVAVLAGTRQAHMARTGTSSRPGGPRDAGRCQDADEGRRATAMGKGHGRDAGVGVRFVLADIALRAMSRFVAQEPLAILGM